MDWFSAGHSCGAGRGERLDVPRIRAGCWRGCPIYGIKISAVYRDWEFIAVKQPLIPGMTDQLRAQLGNEIAIKAFKERKVPFPDGSIIAALHWTRIPAEADDKVLAGPFPGAQSFIVGSPMNVQFMVKDSKKYAATGGRYAP
jgi:hypothetical protein